MATKLKPTIGTMTCMCCGSMIPIKQADTGTLDLSCKHCDLSAYAKAGTEAHRRAMSRIAPSTMAPAQAKPPAPAPVATPAPPPPPPKKRGIFEL